MAIAVSGSAMGLTPTLVCGASCVVMSMGGGGGGVTVAKAGTLTAAISIPIVSTASSLLFTNFFLLIRLYSSNTGCAKHTLNAGYHIIKNLNPWCKGGHPKVSLI